ncbi:MAG: signal peptidase I [Bdellovibrionaceae bacterium]|nr:signal peptidase I [Pseudobdellovibrionaceae bacterium]
MKQRQASFLVRYVLQSFAIVLILGVLLRTFVFSSYVMSGSSMLPSIWPGDFLLAGKWGLSSLRRGDVVVMRCPGNDQICLKRIVGLPGDRIEIREGNLIVNDQKALLTPVVDRVHTESIAGDRWLVWSEPALTSAEPIVVSPSELYLLNDQRTLLDDSRSWGPIKSELIEARALRIWLSLDWLEEGRVRTWPRVRWERMFRSIN